jgi:hypothetical protein
MLEGAGAEMEVLVELEGMELQVLVAQLSQMGVEWAAQFHLILKKSLWAAAAAAAMLITQLQVLKAVPVEV